MATKQVTPRAPRTVREAIMAASQDNGKWLASINQTLGDGLAAIALACSTPDDNSAEVKREIERIRQMRTDLEESVAGSKQS